VEGGRALQAAVDHQLPDGELPHGAIRLGRHVDHIEHFVSIAGIDSVGIGSDFAEPSYRYCDDSQKALFMRTFVESKFVPNLLNHGHTKNVTRSLLERGFSDDDVEKILALSIGT
jgi:membrane dipeptidase